MKVGLEEIRSLQRRIAEDKNMPKPTGADLSELSSRMQRDQHRDPPNPIFHRPFEDPSSRLDFLHSSFHPISSSSSSSTTPLSSSSFHSLLGRCSPTARASSYPTVGPGLVVSPKRGQGNQSKRGDPEEGEAEDDEDDIKEEYSEERYYRTPSPDPPSSPSSSKRCPTKPKGNAISVHDNGGHDNGCYENANDQSDASNKCESI